MVMIMVSMIVTMAMAMFVIMVMVVAMMRVVICRRLRVFVRVCGHRGLGAATQRRHEPIIAPARVGLVSTG
jgi:hypothetical protein